MGEFVSVSLWLIRCDLSTDRVMLIVEYQTQPLSLIRQIDCNKLTVSNTASVFDQTNRL